MKFEVSQAWSARVLFSSFLACKKSDDECYEDQNREIKEQTICVVHNFQVYARKFLPMVRQNTLFTV
jgi:hypothetical protein